MIKLAIAVMSATLLLGTAAYAQGSKKGEGGSSPQAGASEKSGGGSDRRRDGRRRGGGGPNIQLNLGEPEAYEGPRRRCPRAYHWSSGRHRCVPNRY